jgi:3',5'-cyclic AMP phosphodiesterase CpdA
VVLLTGDATDKGTKDSYSHLNEILEPLQIPLYVVPGNHDVREEMRAAFRHHPYMPSSGFIHYAIDDYPVRLIGLDTLVSQEPYGRLSDESIFWLEKTLSSNTEKPTLIFMHHPPIKTGMELFDQILCKAPPAFEGLVAKSHNLIGIFTGHYHHLCVGSFGGKLCFLAPSVAPVHYFAHPQDTVVTALELEEPAVTLHKWHGGNTLTSHVVRVREKPNRIDWAHIKQKISS